MSMPITIEMSLVTEGKEIRLPDQPNCFKLIVEGYRLFFIDQVIEIKRQRNQDHIGFGKIIELRWKDNQTTCHYRLTSLQSVN